MIPNSYKVLDRFRSVFDGTEYRHRASNQGDWVASFLVDDMYSIGHSEKLARRVREASRVLNTQNRTIGKPHRRGDGTFGVLVPGEQPVRQPEYTVAFAPVANVEIGAETKILSKAMIKQVDRVCTDMAYQAQEFRRYGNQPLCVGIVGINHAPFYRSLEGEREFVTTGYAGYRHPFQEAEDAERRVFERVAPHFDELIVLRFSATNSPPFSFSWVDESRTRREYGAAMVRLCAAYERRF